VQPLFVFRQEESLQSPLFVQLRLLLGAEGCCFAVFARCGLARRGLAQLDEAPDQPGDECSGKEVGKQPDEQAYSDQD
jgi:hypothetical protein